MKEALTLLGVIFLLALIIGFLWVVFYGAVLVGERFDFSAWQSIAVMFFIIFLLGSLGSR